MIRTDLYHLLAEALAEPPEWLACAGHEWPLYDLAVSLAHESESAQRAVAALADVRAESIVARCRRYTALFVGSGRPQVWVYESAFLNGRILGPETFAVERAYRAAGVEPIGAELPDHASLELAFLAQLSDRGEDHAVQAFNQQHAGRWLPELGRTLARSGDEVYGPIGLLLTAAFTLTPGPAPRRSGGIRLPIIQSTAGCTLCGFCVQVCPTHALNIRETRTETTLRLNVAACVGCGKCERVCEAQVMTMNHPAESLELADGWRALRESPRVMCPSCGQPTVSRAEFDYVAAQIGQPAWLAYCLDCRPAFMEKSRSHPGREITQ